MGLSRRAEVLMDRWNALWERPFGQLTAHFFLGFFSSDMTADSDNSLSVGAIFALLAVPGLLMPLFLFDKYSSLMLYLRHQPRFDVFVAAIPDRFVFVNFSMLVTGIATVLKWDSLFPDRRDFANLAVLPIPLRRLLYAKVLALAFLIAIFAADINLASTFVFPFIVVVGLPNASTPLYLRMVMSHGVSVVLASLFTFLFFLSVAGTLMSVLPWRWFQRVSRYVRVVAVAALLSGFLSSFSISSLLSSFGAGSPLRWLPPVWFTGLGQALMGHGGNPHLLAQSGLAWAGTALAFAIAAISYVASYRRYFLRIPETLDAPARLQRRSGARIASLAARALARNPFDRACVQFTLWTLVRSEKHSLFLGAYLGMGITLAAQTPASAPLFLAFFLLTGLRVVFDLPAERRANWIFQSAGGQGGARGTARRVMLLLTLGPLALVVLPHALWHLGWERGLAHTAFLALLYVFFTDVLLVNFHKIPFTCAHLPGKRNPAIGFASFLAAFFVFISLASELDRWILARPWRLAVVALFGTAIWRTVKPHLEGIGGDRDAIIFEEEREPAVRTLRIAGI